jgi:hypothetical protein
VKALILMDLRSQHYGRSTGTKPGELIPPLYWVLGQYLFISAIVSLVLFMRVSVEAYAFVNLAVAMVLAMTAVVVEFNEVVLDTGDTDVIGPRPIARRTYAAARMTNLAFYMVLIVLALTIFPAIVGIGLRDSGFAFLPAYALVSVLGCAGIMWLAIVLYSLAPPKRGAQDFRDLLAWAQIIVALVAFYGAQLMLRDPAHSIEVNLESRPAWLNALPVAWLAAWIARTIRGVSGAELRWAAAAILFVVLFGMLAVSRMTAYYRLVQTAPPSGWEKRRGNRPRPLVGGWTRRLAGPSRLGAPLSLCLLLLRRDQDLRMRTLPALTTAAVFLGIGVVLGELGDPFGATPERGGFAIAVQGLVVFAVPSLLHNMSYSRSHTAAWVLSVVPQPSGIYADAVRMAVCYGVILPALAILWICFALLWGSLWHAFLQCLIGWLGVVMACRVTQWGMGYPLPFSLPATRGVATGSVAPYLAGIGTLVTLMGIGQYYAARTPAHLALYVALLAMLAFASRQLPRLASCRVERESHAE